jgi:enamine deaminase RidA (YjgF/YER057c/UK114 family)
MAGQREWRAKIQTPDVPAAPDAVTIGPVLWAHNVTAADPVHGSMPDGGIEAQAEVAFDNLERLLERAGVGRGQLLHIVGYMRDLKDKDVLNVAMVARFPDPSQRPVHKYVPAALPEGVEFALQALAVDGAERRIIEMEGIKHNDPISLGAVAGNVFVSSRVQARLEPTAREQAARLIDGHARALMEQIGGSLTDVTQLVWGIGDPAFEADVLEECSQHWPPERMPRVDIIEAAFPHSPLPGSSSWPCSAGQARQAMTGDEAVHRFTWCPRSLRPRRATQAIAPSAQGFWRADHRRLAPGTPGFQVRRVYVSPA